MIPRLASVWARKLVRGIEPSAPSVEDGPGIARMLRDGVGLVIVYRGVSCETDSPAHLDSGRDASGLPDPHLQNNAPDRRTP